MKRLTKNDVKVRDAILFKDGYNEKAYLGGTRHFEDLSLQKLDDLLDLGFADPNECQNASPSIDEFRNFMEDHPGYTAHGYAVDISRDDCRVTLEGIEKSKGYKNAQELEDFIHAFRFADEFSVSKQGMYCWYD